MMVPDLGEFLERYHDALDAFFDGNPGPAKEVYSHRDDVTLANPFGPVVSGWAEVEPTLERAASNYRDGRATGFETVTTYVTPELAYVVELEQFEAKVGGSDEIAHGAIRVTSVLRPEDGKWRVVHRHPNPITSARPPSSLVQD
jgi:ketosteroid isomerase-like protein